MFEENSEEVIHRKKNACYSYVDGVIFIPLYNLNEMMRNRCSVFMTVNSVCDILGLLVTLDFVNL